MQDMPDGMVLSEPRGMLLTDWNEVAAEVATVPHDHTTLMPGHIDCFLRVSIHLFIFSMEEKEGGGGGGGGGGRKQQQ